MLCGLKQFASGCTYYTQLMHEINAEEFSFFIVILSLFASFH